MHIDNITSEKMTLDADGKSMQISIYEKNIKQLQQKNKKYKEVIEELINWLESKNKIILQQHNIVEPVIKIQEVIDKIKEVM